MLKTARESADEVTNVVTGGKFEDAALVGCYAVRFAAYFDVLDEVGLETVVCVARHPFDDECRTGRVVRVAARHWSVVTR